MVAQATTTAPWKPLQDPLKDLYSGATQAYQSGIGSQPYTGSTVIPFANQSIQGMTNQMAGAAAAQPGMNKAFNVIANQAGNASGMTPYQQRSLTQMQGLANDPNGLNAAQELALRQTQNVAGGGFLNSNKYLDREIAENAGDIARHQAMQASGAGRYGSGGFQGVTQNQIGRMANAARMENYARERGSMDAAMQNAFGMSQTGQQNRTSAIGNVYGMGTTAQNQNIANNQAMSGAYGNMMAPGATMQAVGSRYEDLATRQKQDELRLFNEKQNQPWKQLGLYQSVLQGGQTPGSQVTAQGPSPWSSAAGGALSGYAASGGNPWGAVAGGLAGYFQ